MGTKLASGVERAIQEEIRTSVCVRLVVPSIIRVPSNVVGWPDMRFDVCCDELKAAVSRILN